MIQEQLAQLFEPISSSLRELGVSSLSVFGSFARGESTESRVLDALVEFDGPTTSDNYLGVLDALVEFDGPTTSDNYLGDLDALVEFDGPTTSDNYFDVLFLLEDTIHRKVDLAEPDTLHPLVRERVISEAVRVA